VESGIQKPQTTVLPPLIAASLDRGQAGMVGDGKNVWQNVELRDGTLSACFSIDHSIEI
jgi:hypothetical protein